MNPLAIYNAIKQAVEDSPFANSITVDFGREAMALNLTTRFGIVVKPGDLADTVGASDTFAPSTDTRFIATQQWYTTLLLQADDRSRDEADRWQATVALRNWLHPALIRMLPNVEIVSQQYEYQQERANHVAITMVVRTFEWIQANEDAGIQEILVQGEIEQTLLDHTEIFAVP